MAQKKGNPVVGGVIFMSLAITAIWKNEHRYDYYKEAKKTTIVSSVDEAKNLPEDKLLSYTGPMNQALITVT